MTPAVSSWHVCWTSGCTWCLCLQCLPAATFAELCGVRCIGMHLTHCLYGCRFGVGSPGCSSSVSRLKSSFTADPLDNVVPVVGYESLLPGVQANPLGLPTSLQSNLPVLQQQVPTVNGQQQLPKAQQQQQQSTRLQYSAAHPASAAAIPAPSQPRPMWVPSGGAAASRAAAYAGSPTSPVQQQDRNVQQQPPQQQQQQVQDPSNPAPFVLGTWAQRQYILPVQRPVAQSNGSAGSPSSTGQQQAQTGSSSPARPIPRGKFPSSNGSSNSSGSTRAKAARDAMQHSSSGGSSEPPPASGAKQAAVEAAEAAAQAVDAGGNLGAAANGDDEAAFAMWQAAAAQADTIGARPSLGTDEEEEAVQQIAWRWRFARRWQAEQTRGPLDPAAPTSPGDGGMEEALQYLAACGENWQHLSRDSSRLGTVESRMLGTLGSMGCLGAELLADESFSAIGSGYGMQSTLLQDTADSTGPLAASCAADSREVSMTGDGSSSDGQAHTRQAPDQPAQQQPARRHRRGMQPRGEATVQVTGITKRAQELLEAQRNISRQAHERWAAAQAVSSLCGLRQCLF